MRQLSIPACALWAKKGKPGVMTWLPLYQHMADSAGVVRYLWNNWLPKGLQHLIESGLSAPDEAEQLLVFLAAAHDLGKASPVFQAKPRSYIPDDLDEQLMDALHAAGLPCDAYDSFLDKTKTGHALISQQLLMQARCDPAIATIIGAHHGRPVDSIALNKYSPASYANHYHMALAGKDAWQSVQRELTAYALRLSGFESLSDLPCPDFEIQLLLIGLVIMADWLASNEGYFPYAPLGEEPPAQLDRRSDKAWKKIKLPPPWYQSEFKKEPSNYYMDRFEFNKANPAQEATLRITKRTGQPGILILEAPMGSGKTEAALVAAEVFAQKAHKSGVFFALPTQATSNAIFPRLLEWTKKLEIGHAFSIRLAHGKAQFNDAYLPLWEGSRHIGERKEDAMVHQWFEGNKKSLLADFVVGTIDQFLLSALKQKHVMLRHLGLAGKVVILDECHAYDAYMNQYLDRALNWMGAYRVPVIILSATLPAQRRAQLINAYLGKALSPPPQRRRPGQSPSPLPPQPAWAVSRGYPLITWTDDESVHQEEVKGPSASRQVILERLEDSAVSSRLKALLQHGGYAGVMVNTVNRAQQFAQALRTEFGADNVTLTHARFITPDRAATESMLLEMLGKPKDGKRRQGLHIVVGTQVIEQSLDLDFDVLITDLCPMDLLLQRMGRLHRHHRSRPQGLDTARCLILGADGSAFELGTQSIYKAYPLMRTLAFLPQDSLCLPGDISHLVQDVYEPSLPLASPPPGFDAAKQEWDRLIARKEGNANTYRIKAPHPEDALMDFMAMDLGPTAGDAAVRDGADSVEVLLIRQAEPGIYGLVAPDDPSRIPAHTVPGYDTARLLARQSLRLPAALCHEGIVDKMIGELETSNQPIIHWQESPWLKGMLFLILDQHLETTLCGYHLTYRQDVGLLCDREGEVHEGKGV